MKECKGGTKSRRPCAEKGQQMNHETPLTQDQVVEYLVRPCYICKEDIKIIEPAESTFSIFWFTSAATEMENE